MDVDEFYNLLFDRWEAQMPSEGAKKTLRSYYGGHLVQQVKSKECEHISERMEPFSAIQCDIKGKTTLEESLQAYVDGEIMEGENKYKCSECDRHVDAVKRACLKDIPDNLIFHLKRFDFNLKTLQRSKINDYFAFPAKIDMQPYTIEHLSGIDSSESDVFELVGVLVHSGTAETGHYYSFIRERPNLSDKEPWVEFNDDMVTPWDPSSIESACFGGADFRPHFDAGGAYDKVYSAYMLFYQRSSAVKKEKELLQRSGQSGPLRCDLPSHLEAQVKEENWGIVQRHCLHDQSHIPFVHKILSHKNPEPTIRQETAYMLIAAISNIKVNFPDEYGIPDGQGDDDIRLLGQEDTIIMQTVDMFTKLWDTFHNTLRSWPEYFGTLTAFAQLGQFEAAALLDYDFLAKPLLIISADPTLDLSFQYAKMLTTMTRRMATRPPNYENIINLIDALLDVMDPKFNQSLFVEQSNGRFTLASEGTIPFSVNEVNLLHKEWGRNQANIFIEKLIQLDQNPIKTDSIVRRIMGLSPLMTRSVFTTLKIGITGQIVTYLITPYLRAAVTFCRNCAEPDLVRLLIRHISLQCRVIQNAEGRSFFEFQRDVFDEHAGATSESVEIQSLETLSEWAPGLLGYLDRTISGEVEAFIQEKLLRHGPSPAFGESNGGLERSRAMNQAARQLAISCLEYLRDTYVSRSAQAARETVLPLDKVIKVCEPYFNLEDDVDEDLSIRFQGLRDVLESMSRLIVDELEEDGSGRWSDSSTGTLDYN
ncbi:putative ubiquitin carboxyl-terminal hydrolase protein [Eutypa lata UCREL1]|uniref:Putative ubiquitin carboxyl-terminal hydrolase protein n=1 Tax=Eutypa lata (strain UCR-EL1) TaxID=1287681 RepID=M7TKY3_EUTLA|nr:putative ubiquitin carboxyl-terminal hydrolase protein [Eutypa lata UCREL1]